MTVRTEPEQVSRPLGRLVLGLLLVALGLGWLLSALGVALPWRTILSAALIGVGVVLVVSARWGAPGGLVGVGIALTLLLALGTSFDPIGRVPLAGGVGERVERPASAAELAEAYELGTGSLTVDLRRFDLSEGTTEVTASVGVGELRVLVPEQVTVEVKAEAGIGEVRAFSETRDGIGVELDQRFEGSAEAGVVLDLSVGIGQIEVDR